MTILKSLVFVLISLTTIKLLANATYQAECSIYGERGEIIRSYPGNICAFFSDGSFLSATGINLTLFGKDQQKIWTKALHIHHQMNSTQEPDQILALSSSVHEVQKKTVRFDVLLVLSKSGKVLKQFDFYERKNEIRRALAKNLGSCGNADWAHDAFPNVNCDFSHANSFYEIPDNPVKKKIPAFAPGNYIVNDPSMGGFMIFDRELKRIIWTYKYQKRRTGSNPERNIHDVQILKNGNLIIYNNISDGWEQTSLDEFNPVSEKLVWTYRSKPSGPKFFSRYQGGVQVLENDNILFSDITNGGHIVEIDRNGREIWRAPIPFIDKSNGKPRNIQQVKKVNLDSFLKATSH